MINTGILTPILRPKGLKFLKKTAGDIIPRRVQAGSKYSPVVKRMAGKELYNKLWHQGHKQWVSQINTGLTQDPVLQKQLASELKPYQQPNGATVVEAIQNKKTTLAMARMITEHPEWFTAHRRALPTTDKPLDKHQLSLQADGSMKVVREMSHKDTGKNGQTLTTRVFNAKGQLETFERSQNKETLDESGSHTLQDKRIFKQSPGYEPEMQRHTLQQTFFRKPQTIQTEDIDAQPITVSGVNERVTLNQRTVGGDLSHASHRIADTLNTDTASYLRQHGVSQATNPYDLHKDGLVLQALAQQHEAYQPSNKVQAISLKHPSRQQRRGKQPFWIKPPWEWSMPTQSASFKSIQDDPLEPTKLPMIESLKLSSPKVPVKSFARETTTLVPLTQAPLQEPNALPVEYNRAGKRMVAIPEYEGRVNPFEPAIVTQRESFKITPLEGNIPAVYQHTKASDIRSLPTVQDMPIPLESSALNRFQYNNVTTQANHDKYPQFMMVREESKLWRQRPLHPNPDGDVGIQTPTPQRPLVGVS
ncbi:MAG: hypothetical protein ACKO37_08100 [Vampirovibrionales bacterium]